METECRSACGVPCAASPSGPTSESGGAGGILSAKGLSTGVCADGQRQRVRCVWEERHGILGVGEAAGSAQRTWRHVGRGGLVSGGHLGPAQALNHHERDMKTCVCVLGK